MSKLNEGLTSLRVSLCVLFTLLVWGSAKASIDSVSRAPLSMSLEDALKVAMSQSNTIRLANYEVERAQYDRKAVLAKFFPNVSLSGDYNYTLKKQVMYLGDGFKFPGMPEGAANKGIEVGRTFNVSGGVVAGMPIVNVQAWMGAALSKQNVELSLLKASNSKVDLCNQVTKAYYTILLAQKSLNVISVSYENAKANYADIAKKFDVGLVAEYDKLRADVAVKNLEPSLQAAENALSMAKLQLKILLSLDIDLPITCTDVLDSKESHLFSSYLGIDEPKLNNNGKMKELDAQIGLLQGQKKMELASFYPTVSASFFYRYSAMDNHFSWNKYQWTPYSAVQLTFSIPLFSGGERWNKVQKANVSIAQAQLQRQELNKSITAEAIRYRDNMKTAISKCSSSKEAVANATKGYEIAKKRYDVGSSTLLELNDANVALLQAQLNYYEAIYDFLCNESDLNRLYGSMPLVPTTGTSSQVTH